MSSTDSSGEKDKKSFYIFGRNVAEIPCFRDSLLNGILSGFGGGLAYFLFTSNGRYAGHFAVGTYTAVTFGYWCVCRYNYSKLKFEYAQLAAGMKLKTMYEGTALEKEIKHTAEKEGGEKV